jgi:hypothetical protein
VDTKKTPLLEHLCQLLTTVFERCGVGIDAVTFRNLAVNEPSSANISYLAWRKAARMYCTNIAVSFSNLTCRAIKLQTLQRREIIVQLAKRLCSLAPLPLHVRGQALCEHSVRQMVLALEPHAEPGEHTLWLSLHLCQRCLRLGQPEGHVHGAVHLDGGGQLSAGLLLLSRLGV